MLLLAVLTELLQASVCGTFLAGGACRPAEYVTLLSTATAEVCAAACASKEQSGCCWHNPAGEGSCQFAVGAIAYEYGEKDVRSASNCTGGVEVPPSPQQLHIAYGVSPDQIMVQWAVPVLFEHHATAALRYAPAGTPPAQWVEVLPFYNSSGPGSYTQYRVLLKNLTAGGKYEYSVGWRGGEQVASKFVVRRDDLSYAPRIAMFADLGWTDNQVLPMLREESEAGSIDAIVMFGDYVYWDNGENENAFMRDVMRWSGNGSIPVMTTPGNGDYDGGDYTRYRAQFGMPNWENTMSLYHSFDIGRAHISGIDTELIEHPEHADQRAAMLAWFEDDMKKANANRAQVPWIVVHFHRPAYTTGGADAVPYQIFEPLMYKYGVDLVFSGHVHNQERSLPVYNKTVHAGPDPAHPYNNAKAPVYITCGNPGNAEEHDPFYYAFASWTAWRSYHFGYSHMTVHNASVLSIDFVSTGLGGTTDSFAITKTQTCNFGELCTEGEKPDVPKEIVPTASTAAAVEMEAVWKGRRGVAGMNIPAAQLAALKELYSATNGAGWNRSENWMNGGDPCSPNAPWHGVTCNNVTERTLPNLAVSYGVTCIALSANNLQGQIPTTLGTALSETLQSLDLASNLLTGAIPPNLLRGMKVLHTLQIEPKTDGTEYRLTGELPEDMGLSTGLPNLRFLMLSRNAISGSLPESWSKFSCHERFASGNPHVEDPTLGGEVGCLLWVMSNNLTGSVPEVFCDRTYENMYLNGNEGMACPNNAAPCFGHGYVDFPSKCADTCTPCKKEG